MKKVIIMSTPTHDFKSTYFYQKWLGEPWKPVFEGDDDDSVIKLTPEELDAKIKEATTGLIPATDLDAKIAEAVSKVKETNTNLMGEIELLQKKSTLTGKDREELETRVEEPQNQMLTKEELQKKEQKKITKKHETELTDALGRGDKWKNLFHSTQIDNAITAAAVEHKGYSTEQFAALLKPMARLAEEVGKEGPTGEFITKISFKDVDDQGKEITLDLSPSDAVKRMKEIDKFKNLFAAPGKSGLNFGTDRKPGALDIRELAKDPKAYRQAKKDGLIP